MDHTELEKGIISQSKVKIEIPRRKPSFRIRFRNKVKKFRQLESILRINVDNSSKSGRWNSEEHRKFLLGCLKYNNKWGMVSNS